MFGSFMLAFGTINAAKNLHHHLLNCIFGAPQNFFDTNPKGRILSRFSTDLNTIDDGLPHILKQALYTLFRVGFNFFFFEKKNWLIVYLTV